MGTPPVLGSGGRDRGDACNFGDARRSNAGDASNRGDACEHGEGESEGFSTAGLRASTGTLFYHAGAGVVWTAEFSEQEEESSSEEEAFDFRAG